jgi:hypothetical protein
VKKKWQDVQSLTKKREDERLKIKRQTGGGPPPADIKEWERKVISIFNCNNKQNNNRNKNNKTKNLTRQIQTKITTETKQTKQSKKPETKLKASRNERLLVRLKTNKQTNIRPMRI